MQIFKAVHKNMVFPLSGRVFSLLLLTVIYSGFASEPLLRIGVMSDTHVTHSPSSCTILEDTMRLFKEQKADVIINAGDIADVYNDKAYRNYRNTVNKVYADSKNRPVEIFAYAYHDIIGHKSNSPWEAFKDVKKYLEAQNDPYDIVKVKGYVFVAMPQYHQPDEYKELLDRAEKERDGKPFFIIDHVPLHDTVDGSLNGNTYARELAAKHPDAVHISGHNHSLLTNELNIWQGELTAINAGFLHGSMVVKKSCDVAMIMEVYQDKIVCRRFFVDSRKEYLSGKNPWTIPLPFDQKSAPYSRENRLKNSAAPCFAPDAKIKVSVSEKGANIEFPHASPAGDIYKYQVDLFKTSEKNGAPFAGKKIYGPFMKGGKTPEKPAALDFSIGYFEYGKDYQIKITPFNFAGKSGSPLAATFKVNAKSQAKVVFESRNPMQECLCSYGVTGSEKYKNAGNEFHYDGFYNVDREKITVRVHFPPHVWKGKERGRIIFDMQNIFPPDRSLHMQLRCLAPRRYIPGYILTVPGNTAVTRYVIETGSLKRGDYDFYLNLKNGGPGKIKFDYIRVERY